MALTKSDYKIVESVPDLAALFFHHEDSDDDDILSVGLSGSFSCGSKTSDASRASWAESDVSSEEDECSVSSRIFSFSVEEQNDSFQVDSAMKEHTLFSGAIMNVSRRKPLQWEFVGLTVWLELEEFDSDLTNAIKHVASSHGVNPIPQSHTTAIYGMEHLTVPEAISKLRSVKKHIPQWPKFGKPTGVVQDVATAGNPGQVCSIAWAELTLPTSQNHEEALDILYNVFYPDEKCRPRRHRPWTPHNSIVYDNPEDTVLTLKGALRTVTWYPTLLGRERNVEAISLWDTNGKMEDWKLLERVQFSE